MPQQAYGQPHMMAPRSGGNALLVVGAIGSFLVALALICLFAGLLIQDVDILGILVKVSGGVIVLGFGLLGLGLFGALQRTSPMAIVTGIFCLIAAGGLLMLILGIVLKSKNLVEIGFYVGIFGGALASVLVGVWALTATKAMTLALALPTGLLTIIGGIGWGVLCGMLLDGRMLRVLAKNEGLVYASMATLAIAYILNGIGLFFVNRSQ